MLNKLLLVSLLKAHEALAALQRITPTSNDPALHTQSTATLIQLYVTKASKDAFKGEVRE